LLLLSMNAMVERRIAKRRMVATCRQPRRIATTAETTEIELLEKSAASKSKGSLSQLVGYRS
jgi:hypothetical protein